MSNSFGTLWIAVRQAPLSMEVSRQEYWNESPFPSPGNLLYQWAIRATKGTFHAKMGSIKDRNGMDLTEAEDIKKRWQEYTEELYKKDLHDPDNHYGFSSSHVWMWELDYKESWVMKNWCFWTVMLEKTLETSLQELQRDPTSPS